WKRIPVRLIHEDEGKALAMSDSPWLGYGPLIFRPVVVEALGSLLGEYGELLPLACSEADLMIYNPTLVLDALDESASSIMRFPDGRIMLIQKHVFRSDVVGENDIFTIPTERVSPTFLSHRFGDRWKASGLKGVEFRHVWAAPDGSARRQGHGRTEAAGRAWQPAAEPRRVGRAASDGERRTSAQRRTASDGDLVSTVSPARGLRVVAASPDAESGSFRSSRGRSE